MFNKIKTPNFQPPLRSRTEGRISPNQNSSNHKPSHPFLSPINPHESRRGTQEKTVETLIPRGFFKNVDLHRSLGKRSSEKEGEGFKQWIKRVAVKGPRLEKPLAIAAKEICGGGGLPLRGERRRRRRTTATFRLFLLGKGDRGSRRACIRVKGKETRRRRRLG